MDMCMYTGGHTCVCGSPCSCKYPHVSEVIPINQFSSSPDSRFPPPTWERKDCRLLPSTCLSDCLPPSFDSEPLAAHPPPAALEPETQIRKCQTVNSVLWPRSYLFLGEFHSLSGPFFPLLQHGELEDSTKDHVYTK